MVSDKLSPDHGDTSDISTPRLSRSTSQSTFSSEVLSVSTKRKSLSGRKKKQLTQMFEKGLDDEGCSAILGVDVGLVSDFRQQNPTSDAPSPDKGLAQRERDQLRQMFARQVSPDSCAEILQIDLSAVEEFKAQEEAAARQEKGRLALVLASAKVYALQAASYAKTKAEVIIPNFTKDPAFRVSAASAAVGATAGAVTGGGTGTVVGGVAGAGAGVGPAIFTFGMSIPISMTIGSGIGLCIGVVSGGTLGAVAGGTSGYAGFKYRKELQGQANRVFEQARCAALMLGFRVPSQKMPPVSSEPAVAG